MEQEHLTIPELLSTPQVFGGVRVTISLVLCESFVDRCLSFCLFSFGIVLSVLRYTDYDYPLSIFKLFLLPDKSITRASFVHMRKALMHLQIVNV